MSKKITVEVEVWEEKNEEQIRRLVEGKMLIHHKDGRIIAILFSESMTYDFDVAEFLQKSTPQERERLQLMAQVRIKKDELIDLEARLEKML